MHPSKYQRERVHRRGGHDNISAAEGILLPGQSQHHFVPGVCPLMFFDFSSAYDTILPRLQSAKLKNMQMEAHW